MFYKLNTDSKHNLEQVIEFFLRRKGVPTDGHWAGKLTKKEQLQYFAFYVGKGNIHVDGTHKRIEMTVKVCWGTDSADVFFADAKAGRLWYEDKRKIEGLDSLLSIPYYPSI